MEKLKLTGNMIEIPLNENRREAPVDPFVEKLLEDARCGCIPISDDEIAMAFCPDDESAFTVPTGIDIGAELHLDDDDLWIFRVQVSACGQIGEAREFLYHLDELCDVEDNVLRSEAAFNGWIADVIRDWFPKLADKAVEDLENELEYEFQNVLNWLIDKYEGRVPYWDPEFFNETMEHLEAGNYFKDIKTLKALQELDRLRDIIP